RTAMARQGPRATPPQPLITGATEQTPPGTAPTTEPPTPHQDGTNTPGHRSPASSKHLALASPTTPPATTQTHHITATAAIALGETLYSSLSRATPTLQHPHLAASAAMHRTTAPTP
ncbi:hypothetical protein CHARACLAT_028005, partial [Characodon lateralis]|nr:hypothetical protein [Characodon lateralis]